MKHSGKRFGSTDGKHAKEARWYIYLIFAIVVGAFMYSFGSVLSRLGSESFLLRQKYGEDAYQGYLVQFSQLDAQMREMKDSWDVGKMTSTDPKVSVSFSQEKDKTTVLVQKEDVLIEYELTEDEVSPLLRKSDPMTFDEYHGIVSAEYRQVGFELWAISVGMMIFGLFELIFILKIFDCLRRVHHS